VNRATEIGDSSRYTPTCSFTPGWSRITCPELIPRIAIWL